MLILAAAIYSFIPVIGLYLQKNPVPYTNEQATEKLKANKGDYFEFIVLADNHSGLIVDDSAALKLVRSINREGRFKKIPIDFAAISGDITFRGSAWDYSIYNKTRSLIDFPVISAMGNHDEDHDDGSFFRKYTGGKEFSFSNRNSYFIVIDNSVGNMSDDQFSNLERDLQKSSSSHKHLIHSRCGRATQKPPDRSRGVFVLLKGFRRPKS